MKHQFEDEKRLIIIARKDLFAMTTLLDKMKQLPIMTRINTGGNELVPTSSSNAEIQDEQLAKFMKEIQNSYTMTEDLARQINIYDEQLEGKRERIFFQQSLIDLYNKIHGEVQSLTSQCDAQSNLLKKKKEEMEVLARNVKLSTLDIDFIENRLEARSKLFENYMKANQTADEAVKKVTTELGIHIEDIKNLSKDFISCNGNPDKVHELLKRIKEKENVMDTAGDLLKEFDRENTNLQQLFDAIRLNNMTNIFELLIKNYKKMVQEMTQCKDEMINTRSGISDLEKIIKTKNEHLKILLEDIMSNMKTEPISFPENSNSNKDLLDYFTKLYNQKKDNQVLHTFVRDIKDKGTEVLNLCRDILNYQEKENEKLSQQISTKTDMVNKLQEKYSALHQEVRANTEIIILQSKLVSLMDENEQLQVMNAFFKSEDAKLSKEVKDAEEKITALETENAGLRESNTELVQSNAELKEKLNKMEKYVEFVQRNLSQMQFDEDEVYTSYDSDDSFIAY